MTTRDAVLMLALGLAVGAAIGCGSGRATTANLPDTQQFTRKVSAPPNAIIGSAVATLGEAGIPIAMANEPGGELRTVPVNLRGALALGTPEGRVNCPHATQDTVTAVDTMPVLVSFELKSRPVAGGSTVTLTARRENGNSPCVVRSAFVSDLLDRIAKGAGR